VSSSGPRCRIALAGVACTLGVAIHAAPAAASDRAALGLSVHVDPTVADCPSEDAFRQAVSTRLGYEPFVARAQTQVSVAIESDPPGVLGRLTWAGASNESGAERTLKGDNCSELFENLAVAVAVQIQLLEEEKEEAEAAVESGRNKQSVEQPAVPVLRQPSHPLPRSSSRAPSSMHLLLGAGPSLALGLVPSPVGMGRVFIALRGDALALELGAEASTRVSLTRSEGAGFDVNAYAFSGAVCVQRAIWFGCSVGRLGALSVRGFGVDTPRAASGISGWLGARAGARMPVGARISVGGYADLSAALGRRTVFLDAAAEWRQPALLATAGIDVAFSFL